MCPTVPDLSPGEFSSSFTNFSIPELAEGFDEVKLEYSDAIPYLAQWLKLKRLTTRLEHLVPGDQIKQMYLLWAKSVTSWRARPQPKRLPKKAVPGEEADAVEEEQPDEEEPEVDACEDIHDAAGSGKTLFVNFTNEDWAMLNLRIELYLLVKGFAVDVGDVEHNVMHVDNVGYYYQKYFGKTFVVKLYGKDTAADVCSMVKDTVTVDAGGFVESVFDDATLEQLVKVTEKARRFRVRLLNAGDDSVALNLQGPVLHSTHGAGGHKGGGMPGGGNTNGFGGFGKGCGKVGGKGALGNIAANKGGGNPNHMGVIPKGGALQVGRYMTPQGW